MPPFHVTVRDLGRCRHLVVEGELDMSTAPHLVDAALAAADSGVEVIEIDLAGLSFLDSSGIHALVDVRSALLTGPPSRAECRVRVVSPPGLAGSLLHASGIHGHLEVVECGRPTPEGAVRS